MLAKILVTIYIISAITFTLGHNTDLCANFEQRHTWKPSRHREIWLAVQDETETRLRPSVPSRPSRVFACKNTKGILVVIG